MTNNTMTNNTMTNNTMTDNTMTNNTMTDRKRTKGQTMIYKAQHRTLSIEQSEPHLKPE
jgi:hypothetical protein